MKRFQIITSITICSVHQGKNQKHKNRHTIHRWEVTYLYLDFYIQEKHVYYTYRIMITH